jgi:hypothetical protein
MDDLHLKDAFDDLVARLDDAVDVAALRRRITRARRRRTVAGASTIGVSMAGLVGVVVVAQRAPERAPAAASAPSTAPAATAPPTTVPPPECSAVPTTTAPDRPPDAGAATDDAHKTAAEADAAPDRPIIDGVAGIKGTGTVTAVSEGRVDVAVDSQDVEPGAPTAVTLVVDQATSWGTFTGISTTPSELVAGQLIGFAGRATPDGTYHAAFIDVTAEQAKVAVTDASGPKDSAPDEAKRHDGDTNLRKSMATVVSADASTITVTVHDGPDAGQQRTLALAGATFAVAGVACQPTAPPAAGTEIGIVYDGAAATVQVISLG